jgi:hypothetical protein
VGSIPDFARPAAAGAAGAAGGAGGATSSPDPGAADTAERGAGPGSGFLTQRDLGFAAAPVATDYPSPVTPGGGSGSGPADDSASVWDLAATDVFPVAPPEPGNDDAPGASES